jgi:cellulose synthase/poly-beta-1,6-N-acetylglucosamine synthase-like glycosyltransferase
VRPWLSVVIPTAGTRREGLLRTLESVRQQQPGDSVEVLVVADTYQLQDPSPLDVLQSELQHCNVRYRWLEHDGGVHCFGQPQRSIALGRPADVWWQRSPHRGDDTVRTA